MEGGVGAHGDKSWTSTILIPIDQIYPNLIPCSIMNVDYILMVRVIYLFIIVLTDEKSRFFKS